MVRPPAPPFEAARFERISDLPLQHQLYERVHAAVADGRLRPGERLPSARGLAAQLGLARGTVDAAYARLAGEGYVLSPDARLAVVTPAHQSPLGVALALPRRQALLAWADEADAWVLEDDYDSELHYAGHKLPALKSLDGAHHKAWATGAVTAGRGGKANEPFFACMLLSTVPLTSAGDLR